MRSVGYAFAVGLVIFASGCSKPAENPALDAVAVEEQLRAMETGHRAAINAKDIEGILQYYTSDMITIPPDEPILYGKEWIRTTMADLYKTYDFHENFKFIDIRFIGDRVAASYSFVQQMTPLAGGEKIEQTGKGMCILKLSEKKTWQFEWNAYSLDKRDGSDGK